MIIRYIENYSLSKVAIMWKTLSNKKLPKANSFTEIVLQCSYIPKQDKGKRQALKRTKEWRLIPVLDL